MLTDRLSPLDATLTKNTVGGGAFGFPTFQRVLLTYPLSFQARAHSFALFCIHAKLNSFLFKQFRTLSPKTPGVGGAFVK